MLWDIIRDWFVQYVFGGVTSTGDWYQPTIGKIWNTNGEIFENGVGKGTELFPYEGHTAQGNQSFNWYWVDAQEDGSAFGGLVGLSMSDWLSTTATIIVLIAGCVALFFLVKWLFKMFAGMISGVGR